MGGKQQLKDIIFTGYSSFKAAAHQLRPASGPPDLIVLLYHRVNDTFRDSVTIGVERFDEHMGYLKRHWPVVPLRAAIKGDVKRSGRKPLVCVTFDDGYLDNYENAAPILLKHGLSATFFLSTDKLTNQTPFDHDLEKLGYGLPNMTWDQVREMQDRGLDFGSHTVNHENLAQIGPDEIKVTLRDSLATVRDELGHDEVMFAYPFGKRTDITPEALELVKEAGYMCCCSAYGGINSGELDLFNILRIGVNYNFTVPALRSRLYGWA